MSYVPPREDITVEDFEEGTTREVYLHDGSEIILKKLDKDYDPTDRWQAFRILEAAQKNNWLVTGLIYVNPDQPSMFDAYNLPETPLNRLTADKLRPSREKLDEINEMF